MPIILTTRHIEGLWKNGPTGCFIPMEQRTLMLLGERQAIYLAMNPAASAPQILSRPIEAYIGNGCWRIKCRCGERTHTDPVWKMAFCFGCGARWMNVVFPENWNAIEDLLVKRPVQAARNWNSSETYDMLVQEQLV